MDKRRFQLQCAVYFFTEWPECLNLLFELLKYSAHYKERQKLSDCQQFLFV